MTIQCLHGAKICLAHIILVPLALFTAWNISCALLFFDDLFQLLPKMAKVRGAHFLSLRCFVGVFLIQCFFYNQLVSSHLILKKVRHRIHASHRTIFLNCGEIAFISSDFFKYAAHPLGGFLKLRGICIHPLRLSCICRTPPRRIS